MSEYLQAVVSRLYHGLKKERSAETLLWLSCCFFALVFNLPFWRSASTYLAPLSIGNLANLILIGVAIACLHFLVLLPFINRYTLKPLLVMLYIAGASAAYYSWYYRTYFDVTMINNILETDYRESRDLLTAHFVLFILVITGLPCLWIMRSKITPTGLWYGLKRKGKFAALALVILVVSLLLSFQTFSALMRNHKELRYLINPGNVLVSLPRALYNKAEIAQLDRQPLDTLPRSTLTSERQKPRLLVLVMGETLRAANWGLNGYTRNTTPRLAEIAGLVNFTDVSSCGTSTAVSLPCIFSGQIRDDYSESYARSHESLLDLVKRAGIDVEWVDNQSGCKGVCDGVETDIIEAARFPVKCADNSCMDGILPTDLEEELSENDGNQLLVLHMMGSHGPAYYHRYPDALTLFTPTCDTEELSQCSREEIRNSYDNSILYTDLVLSTILKQLAQDQSREIAFIFVSDHGESLGELGIYLHGLPYVIAPDEQKQVPMIWWLSESFQRSTGVTEACMQEVANQPASHDNLFHSVLGLLDIQTAVYNPALDLSRQCRQH